MSAIVVAAFYKFHPFPNFADFREGLQALCLEHEVTGTILLADEGVNGTIAGPRVADGKGIDAVLAALRALPGFSDLEHKESYTDENPFYRAKVRLKKEIVAMGAPEVIPEYGVGDYVEPKDWNAAISEPDVFVIDTRNDYEVAIGTFEGAIDPETTSFREFPDWFKTHQDNHPNAKYVMFCTGGIRCEKATAYLKSQGVDSVRHLKGGILKYLEEVPAEESMWRGECFVFDNRVSVNHALEPGQYDMCHACRRPLSAEDKASPLFKQGVSCPHCADEYSQAQRAAFEEREKQIALAKARGQKHIGVRREDIEAVRAEKTAHKLEQQRAQSSQQAQQQQVQQQQAQPAQAEIKAQSNALPHTPKS